MKKSLILSMLASLLLMLPGCANRQDSNAGEDRVHGSAGVRIQSRDTSRFMPDRTPY